MGLESIVIIGGGPGGFTTAEQLRRRGFDGSLTVVDPEGLPYDRPPLSKDYLTGAKHAEALLFQQAQWYQDHQIEVIADRAVSLHPQTGAVELASGQQLPADRAVLATGGRPRRLPIPGGDAECVQTLRTRQDADSLRGSVRPGSRAAIIGAGLIGAETASSLRTLDAEVVLIDTVDPPLVPAVGAELARQLHDMHAQHGVQTITGSCREIGPGQTEHTIVLQDGTEVHADVVLVGVGITAVTELAEAAGAEVADGVIVDERQRSSIGWLYAVGDAARTRSADGTLERRAEHWEHAVQSGTIAAAALLGQDPPPSTAPWFWTDRYGVHVEAVGDMAAEGSTVLREQDGQIRAAFRLAGDGTMLGAAAVDAGLTVRAARRIIDRRIVVDPVQLADPDVPLKKLMKTSSPTGSPNR
ncbi:FAD-dependent oxidoreductase [Nesterenkonia sp.]|uniref:NAD(P)/FAD-dependent oxidoreductase n=1 Tax=Nesterenkonia sp. TaxID=704201 RepID=UPI00260F8580|nr:FAD-dependent oxidoreductase [Nesterenkonia sp.]